MLIKMQILTAFLLTGFFAQAAKLDKMTVPNITSDAKVLLGSTIIELLRKEDPSFKILELKNFSKSSIVSGKSSPMAKTFDFNEDGIKDIVVFGHSRQKKLMLVYGFVSDKTARTYKIHILDSYPPEQDSFSKNPYYLNLVSRTLPGDKKVNILQIESQGPGTTSVVPYRYSLKQKDFVVFDGQLD